MGNVKIPSASCNSLLGQVGQKLFPGSFPAHMFQLILQFYIVLRYQAEHIMDKPGVELTGQGAEGDHPLILQKQNLTGSLGHHADRQHRGPGAGVGLPKYLPLLNSKQLLLPSPEILLHHHGAA